jgi:hypothetical protein
MQRQRRKSLVWSSSIDTPELLKEKFKAERIVLAHHPKVRTDFRVFQANFIPIFGNLSRLKRTGWPRRVKAHTYETLRIVGGIR